MNLGKQFSGSALLVAILASVAISHIVSYWWGYRAGAGDAINAQLNPAIAQMNTIRYVANGCKATTETTAP